MSRTCALAALICCAVLVAEAVAAPAAEPDSGQVLLSREETVELFEKLHAAVATAKTFQAKLHRTEEGGFIEDVEPLEFRGEWQIERPSRFRQEIKEPRRSLIVISDTDLWVYFPEDGEVQHVDLKKGIKDREGTSAESFMPWLTFDLEALDKRFRITVIRVKAPAGLVVRRVPARAEDASPAEPVPLPPAHLYEITFEPKKAENAPDMLELVLTVYGAEPWPIRIVQTTVDEYVITTEFSDVLLDAPVAKEVFEFKPPRGTKVVDLSK
jgi:outer membrane lipoprotein-sorting protein